MRTLVAYLSFNGECEEALNFYKEVFGGEITQIHRYGDAPTGAKENEKDKVMHSEFRAGDIVFYASDSMAGYPVIPGSNINLSINFSDEQEQETIFNKLAEGGRITMPLQDTYWGAMFGMLTDKYQVNWLTNCPRS